MINVYHEVLLMLEFHEVLFSDSAFFVYINDLTENLQSNPKFFTDATSLLTIINDPNAPAKQLCEDLDKITEWASEADLGLLQHPRWSALC